MAQWLNDQCALHVRVAVMGDRPSTGTVLLAATNDHMVFDRGGRLIYTPDPRSYVYRPSVDALFQSVVQYWHGDAIGVLLTGMGRDGAIGLKALRNKGHYTIAQDAATSAVYGMPKAAAALNAAVDVLPLSRIGPRLLEACNPRN
jgi:two-component system response regulator WspF